MLIRSGNDGIGVSLARGHAVLLLRLKVSLELEMRNGAAPK